MEALRQKAEAEEAVGEALEASETADTAVERLAIQATLHAVVTPRTVGRVAARRTQGREVVWHEQQAFSALLASISWRLAQGHALSGGELAVLRSLHGLSQLRKAGSPLPDADLEALRHMEATWRPLAHAALQERDEWQGGDTASEARRRQVYVDVQRQQKREAEERKRARAHNAAQLKRHGEAVARWERGEKLKAQIESYDEELRLEIEGVPASELAQLSRPPWMPASANPPELDPTSGTDTPPSRPGSAGDVAAALARKPKPAHRRPPPAPRLVYAR